MQRWLLNHLPTALYMALFVLVAVAVAYAILRLVRRLFPSLADGQHNEITVLSVEIVGALYAILLGFVIVFLWQDVNNARDNVGAESTALSQLTRDAQAFAPAAREDVTRAIGRYAHVVVDDEWPLQREGRGSPAGTEAMNNLSAAMQRYEPTTEVQKTYFTASVGHFNDMQAARRIRLSHVGPSLSTSLRFMMYSYFVAIVAFISTVNNGPRHRHTALLLGVTAIIAFNLAFTTTLDYPFSGDGAVASAPFRVGVLAQFFPR